MSDLSLVERTRLELGPKRIRLAHVVTPVLMLFGGDWFLVEPINQTGKSRTFPAVRHPEEKP